LGATGIWLGVIFASFSLARGVFMPLIGKWSDKRGRKAFITFGLLAYSFVSFLYVFAQSVFSLSLIRFAHGLASAMVIPIAMAYVGETATKGEEGKAMATFNISFFLGMGAGPFLGGLLNDYFGLLSVFYAMSALSLLAFLIALIFLPNIKTISRQDSQPPVSFARIIKNNIIKGLLLFRALGALGRGGIMAFLPLFAATIKITSTQVGVLLGLNIFLTALLQRPFGRLADKFNRLYLILAGSFLGALALILIPLAGSLSSLFVLSAVMGLGGALSMPAASAIVVEVGKKMGMGASMGLFNTAMSIGLIAAPILSGIVMDLFGIKAVFYVAGAISFLGTAVFYYFIRLGLRQNMS
jgi:MFS family permease